MVFFVILSPILAFVISAFSAGQVSVPITAFFPNIIGAIIGIAGFLFIKKYAELVASRSFEIAAAALFLISTCFVFPGTLGVHRWASIGTLNLNVSMALTPLVLNGVFRSTDRGIFYWAPLIFILVAIHFFQPDAGQMTAIAAAIIWLLMANDKRSWKLNAAVSSFLLLGLALNLRQPDPLEPVLPVEQIIEVMAGQGITGWILLGVSLCCIFLPALKLTLFYRSERSFGFAGMIYLLAQFVVPSIGNFPVPVIGAGAGPVIGFYLLMGLISISK